MDINLQNKKLDYLITKINYTLFHFFDCKDDINEGFRNIEIDLSNLIEHAITFDDMGNIIKIDDEEIVRRQEIRRFKNMSIELFDTNEIVKVLHFNHSTLRRIFEKFKTDKLLVHTEYTETNRIIDKLLEFYKIFYILEVSFITQDMHIKNVSKDLILASYNKTNKSILTSTLVNVETLTDIFDYIIKEYRKLEEIYHKMNIKNLKKFIIKYDEI
jgi:hypothetical protein